MANQGYYYSDRGRDGLGYQPQQPNRPGDYVPQPAQQMPYGNAATQPYYNPQQQQETSPPVSPAQGYGYQGEYPNAPQQYSYGQRYPQYPSSFVPEQGNIYAPQAQGAQVSPQAETAPQGYQAGYDANEGGPGDGPGGERGLGTTLIGGFAGREAARHMGLGPVASLAAGFVGGRLLSHLKDEMEEKEQQDRHHERYSDKTYGRYEDTNDGRDQGY